MRLSLVLLSVSLTAALSSVVVSPILADQLITNGGFETGSSAGWTVDNQAGGSGTFSVVSGFSSPLSGFPTMGPKTGTYYAVSDQTNPGAHVLYQTFSVAPNSLAALTFDMFVNNQSVAGAITGPLDYTSGPVEYGRVDILADGTNPFSTTTGVLASYYSGSNTGSNPHPYTSYSFNITPIVGGGGNFMLRFAEADNRGLFQLGVDNVSIARSDATPELGTFALMGLSMLPMAGVVIRRRRKAA